MVTCTAVSFGRKQPGYWDDTVVQDCDVEGETDECIDSETDEDFFESEFDESRVMIFVVPFLTVSKACFKLPCLSVKCLAFFICKGNENGGQKAVDNLYQLVYKNKFSYQWSKRFWNAGTGWLIRLSEYSELDCSPSKQLSTVPLLGLHNNARYTVPLSPVPWNIHTVCSHMCSPFLLHRSL